MKRNNILAFSALLILSACGNSSSSSLKGKNANDNTAAGSGDTMHNQPGALGVGNGGGSASGTTGSSISTDSLHRGSGFSGTGGNASTPGTASDASSVPGISNGTSTPPGSSLAGNTASGTSNAISGGIDTGSTGNKNNNSRRSIHKKQNPADGVKH